MRRSLGTPLALTVASALLLAGCGQEAEVLHAQDAPASASPSATSTRTDGDAAEPVDYDVVALLDATAAGGTTSRMLTPVSTPAQLDTFVSQFRLDDFAEQIRDAAHTSYDGRLWAGVVSVGCGVPRGVFVEEGEAGYLVTPQKSDAPAVECLAPVTTVALVAIR